MQVKVGTFNLNNLFSRFNFQGAINSIQPSGTGSMTIRYEFIDANNYRIRTFLGKLVKAKDAGDTNKVAQRILDMDLDVLAVQEVENINILKEFNKNKLNNLYPYQILIEGNDRRFIDVGLLSKLPVGAVTSFQTAVHPMDGSKRVFSRDLQEVEILNATRNKKLFTIYNNHLKSHYGDDDHGGQGKIDNDARRRKQAEMISVIVGQRLRSDAKYIITGDMNDAPDANPLQPMLTIDGKQLVNGLANPTESRAAKKEDNGQDPATPAWTYRHKETGQPPQHFLYDQIWLSQALAGLLVKSEINRRKNHGGVGSDHDPAWVALNV